MCLSRVGCIRFNINFSNNLYDTLRSDTSYLDASVLGFPGLSRAIIFDFLRMLGIFYVFNMSLYNSASHDCVSIPVFFSISG